MSEKLKKTLRAFFKTYPVEKGEVIGVGVSGGADSLCLLYLLVSVAKEVGVNVRAVTVNHQLRPEAAKEAEQVGVWACQWGIQHDILVWNGQKPIARVEERAREKRYELMTEWCRKNGIHNLFLAHQLGDQAETFWSRLARSSGVDGLSAMAPVREQDGILLCRPFLEINRQEIVAVLEAAGIVWCEDEMNRDAVYERVRWRHRQKTLSQMGLTPDRIGVTTNRLRRARVALEHYTDLLFQQVVVIYPEGYATMNRDAFEKAPEEMQVRVLRRVLSLIGRQHVTLEQAEAWLRTREMLRATLGGCYLIRQKKKIWVAPEFRCMPDKTEVEAGQSIRWGCFHIQTPVRVRIGVEAVPQGTRRLPFLVRRSIPMVQADVPIEVLFQFENKKKLENRGILSYKKGNKPIVVMTWMTV